MTVSRLLGGVNGAGLATVAALAGLWEAAVSSGLVDYEFLPAPSAIIRAGVDLAASGVLISNLVHTLTVTLVGWVAAGVLGIGLGLLLGLSRTAYRYSITSFEVTRAIPPITFVPAALLIFGFSARMELVIVVYAGVWPLLINTIGGVREVSAELVDVARTLRLPRMDAILKVVLPAAMPAVVVGLRLSLSLCLVLAVVAEMIGNPAGLGHGLVRARLAIQPAQMFAYVLTIGLLGVSLNGALRAGASALLASPTGGRADSPW